MRYYLGFFIGFLVIIVGISSCEKKEIKPALGDVFIYQNEHHNYTTIKVVKVKPKTVWYVANDYEVSEHQYIDSIFSKNQYTNDSIKISRQNFNKLVATYERKSVTQKPK